MGLLKGQTAVVFGGSGFIGSSICQRLAREGARVVVHYHQNEQAARHVVSVIGEAGGMAQVVQADVTDKNSVGKAIKAATERYGAIQIAVNTVHKRSEHKPVRDLEWADWKVHLDALRGHFTICTCMLPVMRHQAYGRIVYVSGGFSYRHFKGCALYSTIKSGLNSFCKTLALEEGDHNITVNIVAPGQVFPAGMTLKRDIVTDLNPVEIPLKRFASPEDVAEAVLYFVSPAASGITGQTLFVAGGEIMP